MHLSDEDLIRHLDDEDDQDERAGWSRHMEACDDCARRFVALEDDSRTVTRWLERAAFEVPHGTVSEAVDRAAVTDAPGAAPDRVRDPGRPAAPGRSAWRRTPASPWLRAAVIVLLMAAPAVAIPSVREWVVARVALLGPATPPAPAAAPAATGAAVIRFAAAPGEFVVRVEPQAAGSSLALARVAGEEAVLASRRAEGADPSMSPAAPPEDVSAAPVVSAELLRLRSASAPMRYRLGLPASTTDVIVHVDGKTIHVTGAQLSQGVSLAL